MSKYSSPRRLATAISGADPTARWYSSMVGVEQSDQHGDIKTGRARVYGSLGIAFAESIDLFTRDDPVHTLRRL